MQQLLGDSLHSGIVWGVQKFQQHQFFLIKMQQEETHPQHCNGGALMIVRRLQLELLGWIGSTNMSDCKFIPKH